MGLPPIQIEILTTVSGVEIEDIEVPVISLDRLKQNKAAAGRAKDLADLESLA